MRQSSPLLSALRLGAGKILVVGVGQPEGAGLGVNKALPAGNRRTLGAIAGHAMASIFQDTFNPVWAETAVLMSMLVFCP